MYQVPPKHLQLPSRLHNVISQKANILNKFVHLLKNINIIFGHIYTSRNIIHTQNLWELHGNSFNPSYTEVIEQFLNKLNKCHFLHILGTLVLKFSCMLQCFCSTEEKSSLTWYNCTLVATCSKWLQFLLEKHETVFLAAILTSLTSSLCLELLPHFFPSQLFLVFFS
jgi:hypothetical protein